MYEIVHFCLTSIDDCGMTNSELKTISPHALCQNLHLVDEQHMLYEYTMLYIQHSAGDMPNQHLLYNYENADQIRMVATLCPKRFFVKIRPLLKHPISRQWSFFDVP